MHDMSSDRTSTRRAVRVFAVAVAVAVVLPGCGAIQERKEQADRIIGSVDKAIAAGSAHIDVAARTELKLEGAERMLGEGGPRGAVTPSVTVSAQADLGADRVAYLAGGAGGAPQAVRIFSGTTIYVRRVGNAAAGTQRPWVRLDLTSIDPEEIDNDIEVADALRRVQETAGFDNPLFLLKLLRGALSGSIEDRGADEVRGVPTRHYKLNLDREKAVKDEDEEIQDAYEAVFKSMFATATVFPGEVWLDNQGVPRRYSVTLKSKVRRRALADFRLTVEMFDLGQPVQIVLPDDRETARVEGLGSLAQAVGGGA